VKYRKLWYIPGWASARSGDCNLLRSLRSTHEVEVIWLPDYGNANFIKPGEIYADAVASRLRQQPGPITLVGWSIGGMVAIELAHMLPQQVNGLVLLSTTAKFCRNKKEPSGASTNDLAAMQANLDDATLRRFLVSCYHPSRPSASIAESKVQGAREAAEDQLQLGLTYLIQADLRPVLPQLIVPILIAHGEADAVVHVEASKELAGMVRTNFTTILAGLGHMLPETAGDQVSRLIIDFAGQIDNS
jgi:pimeloyl-[acyl-carrier protein] methyl ester esterase